MARTGTWRKCGSAAPIRAYLRLQRRLGVGSCARAEDSSVWGVVFAVSDRDLIRLDRFEGVGTQAYRREMIELRDLNGHPANAWTYFANAEGIGECVPHRDYIDLYIRGAEHFALPEDYVRTLREIRAGAKLD